MGIYISFGNSASGAMFEEPALPQPYSGRDSSKFDFLFSNPLKCTIFSKTRNENHILAEEHAC
jgi:hypothetical protein